MMAPEAEKLPLEWRNLDQLLFRKLLVLRCLRPDRLTAGIQALSREVLGKAFTTYDAQRSSYQVLADALDKSSPQTPIFFILSQGSDVAAEMDKLARDNGMQKQAQCVSSSPFLSPCSLFRTQINSQTPPPTHPPTTTQCLTRSTRSTMVFVS
jgi:hypothetical protein